MSTSEPKTIFITGATGLVGQPRGRRGAAAGHRVRASSGRAATPDGSTTGASRRWPETWKTPTPCGAGSMGPTGSSTARRRSATGARSKNSDGSTSPPCDSCSTPPSDARVGRFVHVSSLGVYEARDHFGNGEIRLPDLGEGLTESEIVAWKVAPGDRIELNQVIAEVETAKAVVDLPSPFAGIVARLMVDAGVTVAVGDPIISVELGDGGGSESADEAAPPNLVGYGATAESTSARKPRRFADTPVVSPVPSPSVPVEVSPPAETPARRRAAPPVRLLARQLGIPLDTVEGTGDRGLDHAGRPGARQRLTELGRIGRRVHAHPGHRSTQADRAGDGRERLHGAARDGLPAGRRDADPGAAGAAEG